MYTGVLFFGGEGGEYGWFFWRLAGLVSTIVFLRTFWAFANQSPRDDAPWIDGFAGFFMVMMAIMSAALTVSYMLADDPRLLTYSLIMCVHWLKYE